MFSVYEMIHSFRENPAISRVISWILPFRFWLIFFTHLLLVGLSYTLTFLMLNDWLLGSETEALLKRTLWPLLLFRLTAFWHYDLYVGLWRYVSFQDLLNIIRALLISSALFIALGLVWKPMQVPETVYILDWLLCIMLVGGIRFLVRNFREKFIPGPAVQDIHNILVVGPVGEVHQLVKDLVADPYSRYYPVAVIDPGKEDTAGVTRLIDVPVMSMQQVLKRKYRHQHIESVVLCWPAATRKQLDMVVETLKPLNVPFKTIPKFEEIMSGDVRISDIRSVEIDDLLERPPIHTDMVRILDQLKGKTLLVTGGGGSIGSELCRQIAEFSPERIVIVERSEQNLYHLQLELNKDFPDVPVYSSISSINDYPGLCALLKEKRVDFVFHAAAYKHVPLMEAAPIESAYNNILGTYNLARASVEAGVSRFVMISTDKAVNSTNVMGVTKRIAELLVQSYNGRTPTKFMIVRFGNVLDSAGSVTPLFKKQIIEGGPVTVTHPDIERFFMTIPEAVQLILQAGAMGKGGEIFVLDMGEPVRILHLAEKLITLSGKVPHQDVEIAFTGLRPGEKMYEELFNRGETQIKTSHRQILMAQSERLPRDYIESQIAEIKRLVLDRDEKGLRDAFKKIVPEYCTPIAQCSTDRGKPGTESPAEKP